MGLLLLDNHVVHTAFTNAHSGSFNGTTSTFIAPDASNLNMTSAISVSGWVKGAAGVAERVIVAKTDYGAQTGGLVRQWFIEQYFADPGKLAIFLNSGGAQVSVVSTTNFFDNAWHHFVVTYGNASGGYQFNIYLDGALDKSSNSGTTTINTGIAPLTIGSMGLNGTQTLFYSGLIDDVWLWGQELTSGQVTTIYNSGTPADNSAVGTPVSAWLFENNSNDFVDGNNATATNVTYSATVPP